MKRIIAIIAVLSLIAGSAWAAIEAPSSITVSSKTNTTFTLTWTNGTDNADSIMVYVDDAWVAQIATGTLETYQVTGKAPGTLYEDIYVVADSSGTTANSDTTTITTYYPINEGERYGSTEEALITMHRADSWPGSLNTAVTVSTAAGKDSTTVIIPFDDTGLLFAITGHADSTKVVIRFYGGLCKEPFNVVLCDTLSVTAPGVFFKAVDWGGALPHGYAIFDGQTDNGNATQVTEGHWIFRRNGGF